jgi:hypothetical protein
MPLGAAKVVFKQNNLNGKLARYFQELLRYGRISSGTVFRGKPLEAGDARSKRGKMSFFIGDRLFHNRTVFPLYVTPPS